MKFFKGILWGVCRATLIERSQREACRKLRVEGLEEKEMLSVSSFSFESCSNSAYVENIQAVGSASLPNDPISLPIFDSGQTASSLMNEMMNSFDEAEDDPLSTQASSESDTSSVIIEEIDVDGYVGQANGQITESSGASTYSGGSSSGGSSSGGSSSGGSSSSPYVTYSGGGDYYEGKYIIPEGRGLTFNAFGVTEGVRVTAGISHGGTCIEDFNLIDGNLIYAVGNTYDISTARDSLMTEEDEAFDIVFNIYVDGILTSTDVFSFLLVEKSEFISDVDYGVEASYNSDYYRSCISSQASAGNSLIFRPTSVDAVGTFGAIEAYGNSNIYSLTSARCGSLDVSSYFSINPSSGDIILSAQAAEFLTATNGNYLCTLNILVENSKYRHLSGGSDYSDTAEISLTFSNWNVNRNGNDVAVATPSDGCSITELGQYIGLKPQEFQEWMTVNNSTAEVELFNRTKKLCSELVEGDILLGFSDTLFSVPNTMFAAYCYDPSQRGSLFQQNINSLYSLGFKVVEFYNEQYSVTQATQAEYIFLSTLSSLSSQKSLHGIFLFGHGGRTSFGVDSNFAGTWQDSWGPKWNVTYNNGIWGGGITLSNQSSWSISTALDYQLGACVVQACESYEGAMSLTADPFGNLYLSTVCHGFVSYAYDTYHDFLRLWSRYPYSDNFSHGGFQGTRRF